MNTKLISEQALTVIDSYAHFRIGESASCSVPYFNNSRKGVRAGLRATIGKGSPRDIFDEVEIELAKNGVAGTIRNGAFVPGELSDDSLKHFLVDHNIGIDCSGFAYYVLSAESMARGKKSLDRRLHFPFSKGILGKIRSKMRPAENASVATFAHDTNSRIVLLKDILPGDIITLLDAQDKIRDHILVIHHVEFQNFIPTVIYYSHSMAWPSDGQYGHGVRQGKITIVNAEKTILDQDWSETYTFARAQKSLTEIRRLRWL